MSARIGRRTFMKGATSAFLGMAAAPLLVTGQAQSKTARNQPVDYRSLGKTGLKVSAVSMGVMNCSDPAVLLRAYDLGVNFYDTARRYMGGRNEKIVGKVFHKRRDKVLIQTKVRLASSEKENRESVEKSLKSLRTDYVDVLLAHSLKTPAEVSAPAVVDFLHAMKKEGKARFTGFSAHANMSSLLKAAAKAGCHDVVLVAYNFTHSHGLKKAVALAVKSGIGVVAMKTQAGGYKAADMAGLNPHQAALKYVLMDRNVSAAIPGVTTIEQIEQCVQVMSRGFAGRDRDALEQYNAYLHGRSCTMCGGCEGECPYGVTHTDLLRVKMYHDGYRDDRLVQEALGEKDLLEKSLQCGSCSSCSITCRRGLDIRAQMEWVRSVLA